MATGVVSGVVADLLQKSPGLGPDQVKARLMKTAWKSFPAFSSTTDPTSGITYTDQTVKTIFYVPAVIANAGPDELIRLPTPQCEKLVLLDGTASFGKSRIMLTSKQ